MSARSPSLTALAAALLLAGCASMAPPYERPAAPVPAAYPGEEAGKAAEASASAPAAADIPWQRFFEDERLRRLIGVALQNNRDLRVSVLNVERVRAQYQIQRSQLFPTVGAGASLDRAPSPLTGGQSNTWQVGLQISAYELDLFGRIRSLSDAALATYFATAEGRKAAQVSLISGVANTYLAVLADDELLALTSDTLKTREESLRLTQLSFDNGVVSELDLRQAQSLVENAKATLAQFRRQRAQDENALALLLGQPLPGDLPGGASLLGTSVGPELPAGLPSALLERRPDVREAEQTLRSANANIGAARAAFFPSISLTASAGTASTELSGLFRSGSGAWTFSPSITLPIFDGGRNRANLEAAQSARDIAVAQYEKAVQTAFRDVADALAGRATLGEQFRAQMAQADAEDARFKLSDLRYRNGVASYLDLLDAQRSQFAARQLALQVKLAQLQNQVLLYAALGGGWTDEGGSLADAR